MKRRIAGRGQASRGKGEEKRRAMSQSQPAAKVKRTAATTVKRSDTVARATVALTSREYEERNTREASPHMSTKQPQVNARGVSDPPAHPGFIARCNAYEKRRMVLGALADSNINPHRDFVVELAAELLSAEWSEDEGVFHADQYKERKVQALLHRLGHDNDRQNRSSTPSCDFVLSKTKFPKATRGKRGCKVCIFEGRYETEKTNYCITHNVCLCSSAYAVSDRFQGIVCPYEDWSCWRKYHEYYLPRGLFNARGRIKRGSALLKAKRELRMFEEADAVAHETPIDTTTSLVNDGVRQAEESPAADAASPSIRSDTVLVSPQWYPNTPSFSLASTAPSSEYM